MKQLFIILTALLLMACEPPVTWQYPGPPPPEAELTLEEAFVEVAVFGDSLTYRAEHGVDEEPNTTNNQYLTDLLVYNGYGATVNGLRGGNSVSAAVTATKWDDMHYPCDPAHYLCSPAVPRPDIAVVALGTNDLHAVHLGEATIEEVHAEFDNLFTNLTNLGDPCIVALNVNSLSTSWGMDYLAPPFNAWLASHPDVDHVVDWNRVAADNPQIWDNEPAMIHYDYDNAADRQVYQDLFVDAANLCQGV